MRPPSPAHIDAVVVALTKNLGYPSVPSPTIEHVVFLMRAAEHLREDLQRSIRDAQALLAWHQTSGSLPTID
jgi:hypothetical protein